MQNAVQISSSVARSSHVRLSEIHPRVVQITFSLANKQQQYIARFFSPWFSIFSSYLSLDHFVLLQFDSFVLGLVSSTDAKKRFYVVLFLSFFTCFDVFFLFSKRFLKFFLQNVGKVQSVKQINKKHLQNNSNEIDLWFMCRIELQALAGNSMGS